MTSAPANHWRQPVASPRLTALRSALAATTSPAPVMTSFWQEVAEFGTPMIEPLADEPDAVAATFVWRDQSGHLEHVALAGGLVISDFGRNLLRRVADTDLLALTLRLPADTWTSYRLAPDDSLVPFQPWDSGDGRDAGWQSDPYATTVGPTSLADPARPMSMLDLDPAAHTELIATLDTAAGHPLREHWLDSAALGTRRRIWTYGPALDRPQVRPEVTFWVLDGQWGIAGTPLTPVLDDLYRRGVIPSFLAVFVDSHSSAERQHDLLFSDAMVTFVRDELVPYVSALHRLSERREQHVVSGFSGGGGTALYLGWCCPELFGTVVAQSPSCAYMPRGQAPRWLDDRFRSDPPRDTRFYLSVGVIEVDQVLDIPSLYEATVEFAELLQDLGCWVQLRVHSHGHDLVCAREDFGTAMTVLSDDSRLMMASEGMPGD